MNLQKKFFSRNFLFFNLVLVGIIIGLVVGFIGFSGVQGNQSAAKVYAQDNKLTQAQLSQQLALAEGLQASFRSVAESVLPVVVEINVTEAQKAQTSTTDLSPWFFTPPDSTTPTEKQQAIGSGIIVRKVGKTYYVITNYHVAGSAEKIEITLNDSRTFPAKLVGGDSRRDLALVSFEPTDQSIPVAKLGDSDAIKIGDFAFAIGSPLGLVSSFTMGVISQLQRTESPDATGINEYIQTDASINQGNSGGALVNIEGEIIGINTWIASSTGGSVGLGFAIPINNAKKIIDDLITKGKVESGWIGVVLGGTLDKVTMRELGLEGKKGAFIEQVFMGSPAEKGGVRPGDYITAVDGTNVNSSEHLSLLVADVQVGSTHKFTIIRNGKQMTLNIASDVRKDDAVNAGQNIWPGVSVVSIKSDNLSAADKKVENGVYVVGVQPKSPAASLGLKFGDVITSINGKAVNNVRDYFNAISDYTSSQWIFEISRDGSTIKTATYIKK